MLCSNSIQFYLAEISKIWCINILMPVHIIGSNNALASIVLKKVEIINGLCYIKS